MSIWFFFVLAVVAVIDFFAIRAIFHSQKIDILDTEKALSDTKICDEWFLFSMFTNAGDFENRLVKRSHERPFSDYSMSYKTSVGISFPFICPVCLKETHETVKRTVEHSYHGYGGWNVYHPFPMKEYRQEKIELAIPCCHPKKINKYLQVYMPAFGIVEILIKGQTYAEVFAKENELESPVSITREQANSWRRKVVFHKIKTIFTFVLAIALVVGIMWVFW